MKWAVIGNGDVVRTKSGGAFRDKLPPIDQSNAHEAEDAIKAADAVYIATPPNSHLHYARIAAAHRKPTLCEKPMALNLVEAGIMASIFQESETPLWVAYYRRCLPRFLKIKELVGQLGNIHYCTIRHSLRPEDHPVAPVVKGKPLPWRYDRSINGGGNFVDMGTHHLDLLDYLLGPVTKVASTVGNVGGLYEAEDTVMGVLLAGGVPVVGSWCYADTENEDIMEIRGANGIVRFPVFSATHIETTITQNVWTEIPNPEWVHQPLIEAVEREMNGGDKCPTNWENGLRAMKIQDKILNARPE